MKSLTNNLFRWCNYWGHYSRLLQEKSGTTLQTEVTVYPQGSHFASCWRNIAEVRIRAHRTACAISDKENEELSDDLVVVMESRLDKRIVEVLLHTDIMGEIDQEKWDKLYSRWQGGGGLPFILICKDPSKFLFLVKPWIDEDGKLYAKSVYPGDEVLFDEVIKLYKESEEVA